MTDLPNTIQAVNGYDKDAYTYYPILIVGAGESGIALGCRLKQVLGFDQFRLFDRQAGLGGTWWSNRYPGVACDVPAIFYSFSFSPNHRWSSFHPPGHEIIKYLQDVAQKYEILDKIQCNTDVSELRWLEDEQVWQAKLLHMVPGTGDLSGRDRQRLMQEKGREAVYIREEIIRAKIVASCAGGFVEPNSWPESIPGKDQFEGPIFHSSKWDYNVDLKDKNVVVVGTGCSAAQFVPKLTKEYGAASVTQIMRSPPWVVPRPDPPFFGSKNWEEWSPTLFTYVPGLGRAFRTLVFLAGELDFALLFKMTPTAIAARKKYERKLLKHMKKSVPEKYHEILTPDYGVGCKRRIFDATWFPGLNDPKIELTTQPLTSLQSKTATIGPGRAYPPQEKDSKAPTDEKQIPADAIILANGFEVTTWLSPLRVIGKNGVVMQEEWDARGGPQAYMGNAMDGFPNFFIIFGPNNATGHSSVILASENMVEYSLKFIKQILNGTVKTFEVKREKEEAWTEMMQRELKSTVWMSGGCHSWYKTENGWNATAYPKSQIDFSIRCMFPKWNDWNIEYTPKGLRKLQIQQALKVIGLILTLYGAYAIRHDVRGGLSGLRGTFFNYVRASLHGALSFLDRSVSRVMG